MYKAKAYSVTSETSPFASTTIDRRDPTEHDVQIEILFCGICHSDLHQARNEWSGMMPTVYPCVPGTKSSVASPKWVAPSPNSNPVISLASAAWSTPTEPVRNARPASSSSATTLSSPTTSPTRTLAASPYGGYSDSIVVKDHFVLKVPDNLDLAGTAPLLCAGITTYSPMRHWGITRGKKVGVVGLGGLGHMAVKFAHALGAHTVVFTTSPSKKEDALRLGADEVVLSKDANEMAKHAGSFDFILDAVAAEHDINAYINMLARDGNITMVGAPATPLPVGAFGLIFRRRSFSGSLIGGIAETQEMLDFCSQHNITSDVEVIPIQKLNEAYERLVRSDVKYRFSIDMASLKSE